MYRLNLISNETGETLDRNIPIFRSYEEMVKLLEYYVICIYVSYPEADTLLVGDGEFKIYYPSHKVFKHYRILPA